MIASGLCGDVEASAAYLRLHAILLNLASAADLPVVRRLYRACEAARIPINSIPTIVESLYGYPPSAPVRSFAVLQASELRFTFFADCCQMAMAACVADTTTEPLLRRLAGELLVTAHEHEAITRYLERCARHDRDHPWFDEISEIRSALERASRAGVPTAYVSLSQPPFIVSASPQGAAYSALHSLLLELSPN